MEKKQTHIMYGFITGIIMVVLGIVLYVTGLTFKNEAVQYIAQIPFLVGVILNAMAYSKANDGFVTFGNVFGSGFKMSLIVAIVMVVWSFIAMFVFPDMKDKVLALAREKMLVNPKVTEEQIDMSLNVMKKYWTAIMVAGALFGTLFYGAIFALIGGAIAKKNGERPMTDSF
jgi:Protein of unknown function (DUF4199)